MQRFKPDKSQLEDWIKAGISLRKISKITGYSVKTVSDWCEEYKIKKPPIGRPKGYKVTEKTKKKVSKTIKRIREEL